MRQQRIHVVSMNKGWVPQRRRDSRSRSEEGGWLRGLRAREREGHEEGTDRMPLRALR